MVVKPWNQEMEINIAEIKSLPIWVQLRGLDVKYWGMESLSKIGSLLSIPIETDRYTMEKSMLRYARMLIDISLDDELPEHIEFANDKDVLIRQSSMSGNLSNEHIARCTVIWKIVVGRSRRRQWSGGQSNIMNKFSNSPSSTNLQTARDDGFVTIPRRSMTKQTQMRGSEGRPSINKFTVLQDTDEPNKQDDVSIFMHLHQLGMIRLLETKVKEKIMEKVAAQYLHCEALEHHTSKQFFITYVYGDFNSVLYKEDRIGRDAILDHEIKHFTECISDCGLQEMRFTGPYYTWTNKTVWSWLDRVFINTFWCGVFDYSQVKYLTKSLSDHTPMLLKITDSPKPQSSFHFCDMWVRDNSFYSLIQSKLHTETTKDPSRQLIRFLTTIRKVKARIALEKVQKELHTQPDNALLKHQEMEVRNHYINIGTSVIDIIKQQSKVDWISYGDDCTRYFFVKAKQRKMETYVCEIQDDRGQVRQGLSEVAQVLQHHYKSMLGITRLDSPMSQQPAYPLSLDKPNWSFFQKFQTLLWPKISDLYRVAQ
ncbi:LOW QUALITY PROTEIN: hypothetical protein Cgig2_011886 [Carnegiea gigantea]|uniref:DUF4283 domain-containing protein n=1 Tax=Carnegiea gigantea TaxID=171969 RepID=A0A9Q1GFT4_9CARY|nr:LOW QUALITY PROTEIN: hypothetical protein Cgig2_011886 [Carnegiea gigantea]